MAVYRDIGTLNKINGTQQVVDSTERTQVFLATHDGADKRLLFMNRSFISFTYGGKFIEDFNLIATFSNGRLQKNAYASFDDLTSDYDTINGQFYWGSHYTTNELSFTLATDAITQAELEDFKNWFCPGIERELILSEHPNRAILARLAAPPSLSLVPFEKQVDVKINEKSYTTSTTVYRGEINIEFVMDEPHWYSKFNFIPSNVIKDTWDYGTEDTGVSTLGDKDLLKVYLEDRIPFEQQLPNNFELFLGNYSLVALDTSGIVGAAIVGTNVVGINTSVSTGITLLDSEKAYLFYSGTARSYPTIKFTMSLYLHDDDGYISRPRNKLYRSIHTENQYYERLSYIRIGDQYFQFTTPAIIHGYNQAMQIFHKFQTNDSVEDLRADIRENVNEFYSRAWATYCIESLEANSAYVSNGALKGNWQTEIIAKMKDFFPASDYTYSHRIKTTNAQNETIWTSESVTLNSRFATFTFDSRTGESTVLVHCRIPEDTSKIFDIEENCGDCVRSNFLTLKNRNVLPPSGDDGRLTIDDCTTISSNENIYDFLILYKNMYL